MQLGAHHEALQRLVDILPEVRHKVRSMKPAAHVAGATTHSGKFKEFVRGREIRALEREVKGRS